MELHIFLNVGIFFFGFLLGLSLSLGLSKYIKKHTDDKALFIEKLQNDNEVLKKEYETLLRKEGEQGATIKHLEQDLQEKDKERLAIGKLFEDKFKNLSESILKENTAEFKKTTSEDLKTILTPLKEQLDVFNKETRDTREKHIKESSSLREQIRGLSEATEKFYNEASQISTALKGNKAQGDWGEMSLELLLGNSGLIQGVHYLTQESYKNEEGGSYRPDVIVNLPDKKQVVIDAKVSLTHFMEYNSVEKKDVKENFLKKHVGSIEAHVKNLSEKNYEKIKGLNTPDFVLMFMPLESALALALKEKPHLYRDAYEKKVMLVSPSTLMISLRLILQIWKQAEQNEHAQEIAEKGAKLYDKLHGFLTDLTDIGKGIEKSQEAYKKAMNKLRLGRGNVLDLADGLKELGVTSKKDISKDISFIE